MKKRKPTKLEIKYNFDYDLIIKLYSLNKIYLAPWELNSYLKLRGEKKYPQMKLKGKKVEII